MDFGVSEFSKMLKTGRAGGDRVVKVNLQAFWPYDISSSWTWCILESWTSSAISRWNCGFAIGNPLCRPLRLALYWSGSYFWGMSLKWINIDMPCCGFWWNHLCMWCRRKITKCESKQLQKILISLTVTYAHCKERFCKVVWAWWVKLLV